MNENKIYLILDNIRSAENVGAIFRTADAVGVDKIYLTGYTPAPIDRFGREQKKVAKAALGAEKSMTFEKHTDINALLKRLKEEQVLLIAVEQDVRSKDYKDVRPGEKTAFIFGNEVEGVSENTLSLCDIIAEIPMKGKKESLNVSVSVGVFLYRALNI